MVTTFAGGILKFGMLTSAGAGVNIGIGEGTETKAVVIPVGVVLNGFTESGIDEGDVR